MNIRLWHTDRGNGTLTTEHAASSYGKPVFASDGGAVYGTGDIGPGYLHLRSDVEYAASDLAALSDLIVDQEVRTERGEIEEFPRIANRWRFGASCKTADQLDRIRATLGRDIALNG